MSGSSGAAGATKVCEPGVYKCKGDELWGCAVNGGQELKVETCAPGLCADGQPACLLCKPTTALGCSSPTAREICSTNGMKKDSVPCEQGKPHCDSGECVECAIDSHCPDPSEKDICSARKCISGHCGLLPLPPGPATKQTLNDCRTVQCTAEGGWEFVDEPTDVPASDDNDCTTETCDGQMPLHKPEPEGTPCGPDKKGFCTADGKCGACLPKSTRCNGNLHEVCSEGGEWVASSCSGNSICSDGACTTVDRIDAGDAHTCAVLKNGKLMCWGNNEFGQLGTGESGPDKKALRPKFVPELSNIIDVSLGDRHTCALSKTGGVYCWGANDFGQLGLGAGAGAVVPTPTPVGGLLAIEQLALGTSASCALRQDSVAFCWGDRSYGQVGDGGASQEIQATPKAVQTDALALISSSERFTCGVSLGSPICWGNSDKGEIGINSWVYPPTTYPSLTDVFSVIIGGHHGCAVMNPGDVRCWGDNSFGQLGMDKVGTSQPVASTQFKVGGVGIALGRNHTCQALSSGVICAGKNDVGQLGTGVFTPQEQAPKAVTVQSGGLAVPLMASSSRITAGRDHTCVLSSDNSVRCWGAGESGQLGNGAVANQYSALPVLW